MREIVDRDEKTKREVWDRDKAIKHFKNKGELYKAELIESIPQNEEVSIYFHGAWHDLCRGPHLSSTGKIGKFFKLTKVAGAYWRGNSKNEMLQRIYGTAWLNKKDLEQCFFSVNAGLRRRFPWIYTIEEYTPKELSQIFEKQVGDESWYISEKARKNLPDFFNERKKYFPHFGGDTETLFAKVKILHSRRVFGKPRYMKKEINFADMKKGYELFLENSHVKQSEGKNLPPPGMYC